MAEKIRLGMCFHIDGIPAKVEKICDEPSTGLCVVSYSGWTFTLPVVFVERVLERNRLCAEKAVWQSTLAAAVKAHDALAGLVEALENRGL